MKKLLVLAMALTLAVSVLFTGCTSSTEPSSGGSVAQEGGGTLVLYASTPEDFLNVLIKEFEASTGIKVELVTAGTGELYKRIEAEGSNPLGDVMLGGMVSSGYLPNEHLWENYVSPNDASMLPEFQNSSGKVTAYSLVPTVIMVNNQRAKEAGVTINGFADLLDPALKGQIVMPDPNQTSSGWEALVNMLYAVGKGDTDEGWDYVDKLVANMEGKLLQGSSAVHKGIADGEYIAGLVAEGMVDTYLGEGVDVSKVFMKEGVVINVDGIAIIKGAKNMENAKKFIDFLTSEEFQTLMPELSPPRRPIREDVKLGDNLIPTSDIFQVSIEADYIIKNKEAMLDHFKDIATNYA